MVRIRPNFFMNLSLFTVLLCSLNSEAHKKSDTRQEIAVLRKQVAELNKKVDCLSSQNDQTCIVPKKASGNVMYIKNEYPNFYSIVTQNGPKSQSNKGCNCSGIFCFSALANLDLVYSDRKAVDRDHEFDGTGSFYGIGVNPLYGPNDVNFFGSINNIDLFIDAAVNRWINAHLDLAYLNASIFTRSYAHADTDWNNAYRNAAGLRVNEAYFLFANPTCTPFYIQLGRFYTQFGDYEPYPIKQTLPQLLEQQRSGGINVGAIFNSGWFAQASWTMSQQSLDNQTGRDGTAYNGTNKDRNYGGKLGFKGPISNSVQLDLNASYTADIRDSDYLAAAYLNFNVDEKSYDLGDFVLHNQNARFVRTPGFAAHAGVDIHNVGLYADYVTALNSLNPADLEDSHIWAMDVAANVKFCVGRFPVKLEAGYQHAGNTDVVYTYLNDIQTPPFGTPIGIFRYGHILPEDRAVGTIWVTVMPHLTLAAQWLHDWDFSIEDKGTGRTSNFGTLRVNLDF